MIAPMAPGQPPDTSVATGAPQGSGITLQQPQDPLAKYDPAQRRIRAMTPDEQRQAAQMSPQGADPQQAQLSSFSNANAQANADPNNPQNVLQQDLSIEHPSAFGQLAHATGRRGFTKPRRPGRFGR